MKNWHRYIVSGKSYEYVVIFIKKEWIKNTFFEKHPLMGGLATTSLATHPLFFPLLHIKVNRLQMTVKNSEPL